jgi:hypothetical protein
MEHRIHTCHLYNGKRNENGITHLKPNLIYTILRYSSHTTKATPHLFKEITAVYNCARPGAVAQMPHSARLGKLDVDFSLARRGSKS